MTSDDIFQATLSGNKELVNNLLNSGADINSINPEGKTPLLLALEDETLNVDYAKFLIDKGADVNFRNQVISRYSLLEEEFNKNLEENSIRINDCLCDEEKNLTMGIVYLCEPFKTNILKSAIKSKDLTKVEFVLNYKIDVIYKNRDGLGALYDFCNVFRNNRSEKMIQCLSVLLTKECRDFGQNGFCESAIRFLSDRGHLEAIKMLISFGDSIEGLNWTENHQAVVFSDLHVLKSNLALFYDTSVDRTKRTPLLLFLHFRKANEIKEIFSMLNMNNINLNDIKKGIELIIQADKCSELKELLNYYPVDKEECHRLLMLSRMYRSKDCAEFLHEIKSNLTSEKTFTENELIEEVKKVFKGVKLNDGMSLACAKSYDDYDYDSDEDLSEKTEDWQNITNKRLDDCRVGVPYLDAKGLLFYLPAYMICDINYNLGSGLVYCFYFKKYDLLFEMFLNFNFEQMKITTICFEYFLERMEFEFSHSKANSESNNREPKEINSSRLNFYMNKIDRMADLKTNLNKILNTKLTQNLN